VIRDRKTVVIEMDEQRLGRFWLSVLFLSACASGLRYNYGDGSYYIGQVDGRGRPDGVGKYFNTSGQLGK
jgi:hypothetical protein